ncbi:jg4153 [Pararge aegeria aegeria]|uniref:Jg4153 protein n=1 Tax=Pararge aegeria aegeria TaxID=348720 RepID=A0A8S4RG73_9NEOP|nr:jg4153 [Pararge aegeria aegeria]
MQPHTHSLRLATTSIAPERDESLSGAALLAGWKLAPPKPTSYDNVTHLAPPGVTCRVTRIKNVIRSSYGYE